MANTSRWARGEFSWFELGTRDIESARRFYTDIFGWSAREVPMGPGESYTMFDIGGRDAGGGYEMKGPRFEGVPPHWLPYVATDVLDSDTTRAESLGGSVVSPPMNVPDVGRISVVRDPQGAVVAMFEPGAHEGRARLEGAPGGFCWSELATRDTAAAAGFYRAVFGWGTKVLDMGPFSYTQWCVGDTPVGGMMAMTPEWGDIPAHWLSYISVADCDDTARRAEARGARLIVPPKDIEKVGRFAVIADPQGAVFAVLKLLM
jgi:uncharacterized protein